MRAEDLYRAIGAADPAYLEHSEKRNPVKRGRLLRVGIAAAVIVVLCMSAMAVPAVRQLIFGVQPTRIAAVYVENGAEVMSNASGDVRLDVQLPADAPGSIETYYVPLLPAQSWTPIVRTVTGSVPESSYSTYLGWEDGEGNYVLFQQLVQPGYQGDYTIDTVNLGFNGDYTTEKTVVADQEVQMIAVKPSSLEGEEIAGSDAGRRKLYWSDGSYIFIMEVNYDMKQSLLAQIFDSIAQTDSVEAYQQIVVEQAPDLGEPMTIETPMRPAELPEGWAEDRGGQQPDGSYAYYWRPEDETQAMTAVLEFTQTKDEVYYTTVVADWETTATEHTAETTTVTGWETTVYTAANEVQLLWREEGYIFSLVSSGPNHLSAEQLLKTAASVGP